MYPKNPPIWDHQTGKPMEFSDDSSLEEVPLWDSQWGMPLAASSASSSSGHITGFQTTGASGSASSAMSASPVNNFSHYINDKIPVDDLIVRPFRYIHQFISTSYGQFHPVETIKQARDAVGLIFGCNRFLATAVVIAKNTIMAARHSVNGYRLDQLGFLEGKWGSQYRLELLEDGALIEEDYIIFRVVSEKQRPIDLFISPLKISSNVPANHEWLVCLGQMSNKDTISKYATMGQYDLANNDAPLNLTIQNITQGGFSGAPYINSKGQTVGIHLKTSQELLFEGQRTGLLFSNIINFTGGHDPFTSFILSSICTNPVFDVTKLQPQKIMPSQRFTHFSTLREGLLEVEEWDRRLYLFGGTPRISVANPKRMHATAITLLENSEKKGRAIYDGVKTGKARYRDHAHWQVYVEVTDKQWTWKRLNTKDPRIGKERQGAIQMGHLFSVAEYWNKGNGIPGDKYQYPAKRQWSGLVNRQKFKKEIASPFMSDAENYEFQWGPLNEQRGSPEEYDAPNGYQWDISDKKHPVLR
tara:strand:- start:110501 stop:112087 length:1587 start_codon:yes stop_codon:yes gene_type:complete